MSEKDAVLEPPQAVWTLRVYTGKDLVEIEKEKITLRLTRKEAKALGERISYHLTNGYIEENNR